jgi:hypothetical protein
VSSDLRFSRSIVSARSPRPSRVGPDRPRIGHGRRDKYRVGVDAEQAKERLRWLIATLRDATQRDPEQEVQGIAIPVVDAVVAEAKKHVEGDPVIDVVRDVISPEAIADGEPIRALDMLVVAQQLLMALDHHYPPPPPFDAV